MLGILPSTVRPACSAPTSRTPPPIDGLVHLCPSGPRFHRSPPTLPSFALPLPGLLLGDRPPVRAHCRYSLVVSHRNADPHGPMEVLALETELGGRRSALIVPREGCERLLLRRLRQGRRDMETATREERGSRATGDTKREHGDAKGEREGRGEGELGR